MRASDKKGAIPNRNREDKALCSQETHTQPSLIEYHGEQTCGLP